MNHSPSLKEARHEGLAEGGVPGHKSIASTRRYAHFIRDSLVETLSVVSDLCPASLLDVENEVERRLESDQQENQESVKSA